MTTEQRRMQAVRLRAEREKRGWGQRTLARRLRDAVEDQQKPELPSFVTYVKRWETGKAVVSDSRYRAAYAAVFGIDQEELFNETTSPGSVDVGVIPEDAGDDMRRRAALQLLAALGAGAAIPPAVLETALAEIEDALGNPLDLDEWERTVREYAYLINRTPVGTYLGDLTADVITIGRLLDQERSEAVRAGLLRISAGLSALLAIELGDVGNRRGARLAWGTARRAADASGDQGLRVWVRAREAEEALWTGAPPADILALTAEAAAIADGKPCSGLPRVHATRACLAAENGDRTTAHREMAALGDVFEHLPDTVTSDPSTFGWGPSRLRWNEAYVYTLTGDERGKAAVDEAIALYPPGTLGPVANLHMIRAMGLLQDREIDAALDASVTTLQRLPISPARRHMSNQILRALPDKAHELPAARELRALTTAV